MAKFDRVLEVLADQVRWYEIDAALASMGQHGLTPEDGVYASNTAKAFKEAIEILKEKEN